MTDTSANGYKSGSRLERVLHAGHFAVTGELGPPQSADGKVIREKAQLLKGLVDAVNITDNQTAIVRMSSIGAGTILVQEGLEPVVQMTCRDRNRLAIQSDLLGAYALGMRNLLCLTGDHHSFVNHDVSGAVIAHSYREPCPAHRRDRRRSLDLKARPRVQELHKVVRLAQLLAQRDECASDDWTGRHPAYCDLRAGSQSGRDSIKEAEHSSGAWASTDLVPWPHPVV